MAEEESALYTFSDGILAWLTGTKSSKTEIIEEMARMYKKLERDFTTLNEKYQRIQTKFAAQQQIADAQLKELCHRNKEVRAHLTNKIQRLEQALEHPEQDELDVVNSSVGDVRIAEFESRISKFIASEDAHAKETEALDMNYQKQIETLLAEKEQQLHDFDARFAEMKKDHESRVAALTEEITMIRSEGAVSNQTITELRTRLTDSSEEKTVMIQSLQAQLTEATSTIEDLRNQLDTVSAQKATQDRIIAELKTRFDSFSSEKIAHDKVVQELTAQLSTA